MKPIIGITSVIDDEKYTGLQNSYSNAIVLAGALPIMLPYTTDDSAIDAFANLCDGFFFTGGYDVHPSLYGEEVREFDGPFQKYRDETEAKLFARAIKSEKPIIAICRGAQIVNALMGGTLIHDIPSEVKTELLHRQKGGQTDFCHEVNITEGTPLASLFGKERLLINSWHHQAVRELGEGLRVMATADDGVIEGYYLPGERYLRGYQWHPEKTYEVDEYSRTIFGEFIAAVKKRMD